jgi:hypothetical protein
MLIFGLNQASEGSIDRATQMPISGCKKGKYNNRSNGGRKPVEGSTHDCVMSASFVATHSCSRAETTMALGREGWQFPMIATHRDDTGSMTMMRNVASHRYPR